MQYQISFRKIIESDINVNRPIMPEGKDYEMYLSALIEDIENLDCVSSLNQNGDTVIITIETELDFKRLHSAVKELLNNQFHDKLVVDSAFSKIAQHA